MSRLLKMCKCMLTTGSSITTTTNVTTKETNPNTLNGRRWRKRRRANRIGRRRWQRSWRRGDYIGVNALRTLSMGVWLFALRISDCNNLACRTFNLRPYRYATSDPIRGWYTRIRVRVNGSLHANNRVVIQLSHYIGDGWIQFRQASRAERERQIIAWWRWWGWW